MSEESQVAKSHLVNVEKPKKFLSIFLSLGVLVLLAIAFVVGYQMGWKSVTPTPEATQQQEHLGAATKTAQVWTCSMHPRIRSDQPGQCPICGMDLIPVEDGSRGDDDVPNWVTLSKRAQSLARIVTAEVRRTEAVAVELRLLGRLDYDERRIRTITSWTDGRIDRLHVAVTGQKVRRGQVIATLYSPEIYVAQQDLIQAARQVDRLRQGSSTAVAAAESALQATRERLRLLGVPEQEITKMESEERPFRHIPIRAHAGGTVIERLVDEGAYVNPGTGIYRVADLAKLWVQLDAYERDLSLLSIGQSVSLSISAFPDETFTGQVAFIDPVLNARTRTSRVRVEIDNHDGRLQPGMFAEATVAGSESNGDEPLRQLTIPESAPLFTGRRSVVYVEVLNTEQPTYEARQVRLGHKTGDVYPVIAGLREGERIVVHGAFTLDADLQIRGGMSMMAFPDDTESSPIDRVVDADPQFMSSLEPVLGSYLSAQERLGEDDHEAAKVAMRALERELERVSGPRSDEAREAWTTIAEELRLNAENGAESDDIEIARLAFEQLSIQIRSILERFGNPLSTPLRIAYCPMAFNNRGAEWIQRDEEIDNSYFGAAMRRCGSFRSTVSPGEHLTVHQTEGSNLQRSLTRSQGHQ